MERINVWIVIGAIFGGSSVVLGAFGAHILENMVTPERLATFQTGVQYQMYHALALIFLGLLVDTWNSTILNYASVAMVTGVIIFSGSLYLLVLTDKSWLGAITPFGGVTFIFGWIFLFWEAIRR